MSFEEVALRVSQLHDLTHDIRVSFNNLNKATRSKDKEDDLLDIERQLEDYKNAFHSYRVEFRMQKTATTAEHRAEKKQFQDTFKKFTTDFEFQNAKYKRAELMEGGGANLDPDDEATQLINHGLKVQEETKESLLRSIQVANDAAELGKVTAVKLESQTEQLRHIENELKDL